MRNSVSVFRRIPVLNGWAGNGITSELGELHPGDETGGEYRGIIDKNQVLL